MKRLSLLLAALLCLTMVLTACQPSNATTTDPEQMGVPSSSSQTNADPEPDPEPTPSSTPEDPEPELPVYVPGSIILEPQHLDDYDFERKYRIAYYRIWGEFYEMLSDDERSRFSHWREENSAACNYGETRNEMLLVSYVKEFNITREEFDAAVERFAAFNEGYTQYEEYEIPNADIIYTFDNEIINEYYRYE